MDIWELIEFIQKPDILALPTFAVAFASLLTTIYILVTKRINRRCQRRRQTQNVIRILQDGFRKLSDDSLLEHPGWLEKLRYDAFRDMILGLEGALTDDSSDLPREIKRDVRHLCLNICRRVKAGKDGGLGWPSQEFFRVIVIDPVEKKKWYKANT